MDTAQLSCCQKSTVYYQLMECGECVCVRGGGGGGGGGGENLRTTVDRFRTT